MKLLFDENLSHNLVDILKEVYPGSNHIINLGLRGASDEQIWNYGKKNEFTIVSKDTDFREKSFMEGHPPKIIWLDVGNTGTGAISKLLRDKRVQIAYFIEQQEEPLLILPNSSQVFK